MFVKHNNLYNIEVNHLLFVTNKFKMLFSLHFTPEEINSFKWHSQYAYPHHKIMSYKFFTASLPWMKMYYFKLLIFAQLTLVNTALNEFPFYIKIMNS